MIVKTLMENRAVSEGYAYEHGLSFLIQTEHHTVLFDMGQSDGFAKNAKSCMRIWQGLNTLWCRMDITTTAADWRRL
jgi:hypothetical protein